MPDPQILELMGRVADHVRRLKGKAPTTAMADTEAAAELRGIARGHPLAEVGASDITAGNVGNFLNIGHLRKGVEGVYIPPEGSKFSKHHPDTIWFGEGTATPEVAQHELGHRGAEKLRREGVEAIPESSKFSDTLMEEVVMSYLEMLFNRDPARGMQYVQRQHERSTGEVFDKEALMQRARALEQRLRGLVGKP